MPRISTYLFVDVILTPSDDEFDDLDCRPDTSSIQLPPKYVLSPASKTPASGSWKSSHPPPRQAKSRPTAPLP
ncbi:hypothetical protein BT67DRAFT_442402 [Trichocladium antarcticum]|uniref:Uncharacterized protein n=1 Tax=Trichocladium antarcticum TaxID=1450529 RepID=A0AAN6UJ08_9PEZI|nr:hypothetical protein BT67DRAFT_442402 [Trichocladium antarcticum]